MWSHYRARRRAAERQRLATEDNKMCLATLASMGEDENEERVYIGSVPGRRTIPRDRYSGYIRLMEDYFVANPVYGENLFRRRFRMRRTMFDDILARVQERNVYFRLRHNAAGQAGFHPIQKVTAALRLLAYGGSADRLDEYIRMGESTIMETLQHFTRTIVDIYGPEFLRQPNDNDITKLLAVAEQRGFPGMLGSIDCMHWEWENCPTALQGQYRGHFKKPTLILEAVASHDLWIWHAFFGMPGSCNDINVLHRSPVFDRISSGNGPEVHYAVNGREYNMGYYLADGIYPPWATLIGGISIPKSNKQKLFTDLQSAYRKDVECGFGILQAKFHIIKRPSKIWSPEDMKFIVDCVIILHNMGIKFEQDVGQLRIEDYEGATQPNISANRNVPEVEALIDAHRRIRSRLANEQLKLDLVEHVWNHYGRS